MRRRHAIVCGLALLLGCDGQGDLGKVIRPEQSNAPADERVVQDLLAKLRDANDKARVAAAQALGKLGPAAGSAVPALIGVLDDPRANVRRAAVRALGQIGPSAKPAASRLTELAETTELREDATRALEHIGP